MYVIGGNQETLAHFYPSFFDIAVSQPSENPDICICCTCVCVLRSRVVLGSYPGIPHSAHVARSLFGLSLPVRLSAGCRDDLRSLSVAPLSSLLSFTPLNSPTFPEMWAVNSNKSRPVSFLPPHLLPFLQPFSPSVPQWNNGTATVKIRHVTSATVAHFPPFGCFPYMTFKFQVEYDSAFVPFVWENVYVV